MIEKATHGPDHSDTRSATNNLASTLADQGKYSEAEEIYRVILVRRAPRSAGACRRRSSAARSAAPRRCVAGRLFRPDACHFVSPARGWKRGCSTPSTRYVRVWWVTSAGWRWRCQARGRRRSLRRMCRGQGGGHGGHGGHGGVMMAVHNAARNAARPPMQDVLGTTNNLASTLADQGKYSEAETLYRSNLDIEKKLHGAEHLDTLSTTSSLAGTLADQGKSAEAAEMYRENLGIEQRLLGPEHPDTLSTKG